jgi:hypothetical protein
VVPLAPPAEAGPVASSDSAPAVRVVDVCVLPLTAAGPVGESLSVASTSDRLDVLSISVKLTPSLLPVGSSPELPVVGLPPGAVGGGPPRSVPDAALLLCGKDSSLVELATENEVSTSGTDHM